MLTEIPQEHVLEEDSIKVHIHSKVAKHNDNPVVLGFISDLHLDGNSDIAMIKRFMKKMVDANAEIFILGDIVDGMQATHDPRHKKNMLNMDNIKTSYFNSVLEKAIIVLSPFKDNIIGIGYGNHELTIKKHNEIDILRLIADKLECQILGYNGYILGQYNTGIKSHGKIFRIYYCHGSSGNAPVTDGIIKMKRRLAAYVADIYISGHVHKDVKISTNMHNVSNSGKLLVESKRHIQLGNFLFPYSSFVSQKEFAPGSHTAAIIRFYPNNKVTSKWYFEIEEIT